jgi:hypothetical protein
VWRDIYYADLASQIYHLNKTLFDGKHWKGVQFSSPVPCAVPVKSPSQAQIMLRTVLYTRPGRLSVDRGVRGSQSCPPHTKKKKKDFNHTSSLAFRTMTDGLRLTAAYAAASPVPLTYDFNHSTSSLRQCLVP